MSDIELKVCSKCGGEPQPITNFYIKDKKSGRRYSWCKTCHCKTTTKRYCEKHAEIRLAENKIRQQKLEADPEGVRAKNRAYQAAWHAANPERRREINRRADAKRSANGSRKAYREANAAWIKARNAAYRAEHRDELRDKAAVYREANRDILRQRQRDWRLANPDSYKAIHSRWKKANKALVNAATHRRRATLRGCAEHHTAAEWLALVAACEATCVCCGRQEPEIALTRDHVIPVSKGGSNAITNIQPLCKSCNSAKHDDDTDYRPPELTARPLPGGETRLD